MRFPHKYVAHFLLFMCDCDYLWLSVFLNIFMQIIILLKVGFSILLTTLILKIIVVACCLTSIYILILHYNNIT